AKGPMIATKAVMNSLLEPAADVESLAVLSRFRADLRACLAGRGDELFELADAVLCAGGPVRTLAGLSLVPEHPPGPRAPGGAGGAAAAGLARWAEPAGGGREQLAAAGRGDQPGAAVLPCLRARQGPGADDPRLAVFGGGRAGAGPDVVDAAAGRGAAGSGGRRDRGHGGPGPRRRRPADRGRALAPGRPAAPGRLPCRLRRDPAGLAAGGPARGAAGPAAQ